MKTIQPTNGMTLTADTRFEPGIYALPDGITVAANGVTLDGGGAHLIGQGRQGSGLTIKGCQDITVKNLQLSGYRHGIRAADCQGLSIKHCRITDTADLPAHGEPLNDWQPLARAYGSAILLAGVSGAQVRGNDLRYQMVGLAAYFCQNLTVAENDASHNTGFGFYLYESSRCHFEQNLADHCSRADDKSTVKPGNFAGACGFLLVHGASHNTFEGNQANLCTNGFRLEGLSPDHGPVPCRENRFLSNTAGGCTQSAFADSSNADNVFTRNTAENANTGFWLDRVSGDRLEQNTVTGGRRAGVAARNSAHCDLLNNTIQDNRYGILLWQAPDTALHQPLPDRETSKFWRIQSNTLHHNDTAIRIAAQPENLLTPSQAADPGTQVRPHDHEIRQNVVSDNRLGIQTLHVDRTVIKDNHFTINLMGDIKS